MKLLLSTLLLFVFFQAFVPTFAQSAAENLKGQEFKLRETANVNRKVYVTVNGKTAYYIHDNSRLFPIRKAELVTVSEVRPKKDNIEVLFVSQNLGKGKIRVYDASTPELFDAVIKSAFSNKQTDAKSKFIANTHSGVAHFAGCNHLPDEAAQVEVSMSDIESGKYKKCPLCFYNVPRVSGYDLEMRLGNYVAGQVQMQNALVTDDAIQNRVKNAGKRVLSKWPMPLKGYNYKFYAVDSEVTNAFAVPAGKVYITTGLLDSLESEEELEAVLAHEIAHVELRHGYRQFRSAQKAAFWGGIIAIAVGAAGNQAAFDLANMMSQLASSIVLSGHSRRYESESDSLAYIYFESNQLGKGKSSFQTVLKKLQYNQDFYQPEKQGASLLASHPQIAERIDAIEKSKMQVFSDKEVFYGYNAEGELVATVGFQAQRVYSGTLNDDDVGLQLIAMIETTSALGEGVTVKDISLQTNLGTMLLDNKEDTLVMPNDAVGASFVSKTQRSLVEGISNIGIKMKNVSKWEKKQ
jgi:Zn-dependent protease with chaperone function